MSQAILILASLVLVLIFLDRLVNVFPSLVACVIRWKESINLEASVKLGRDRNLTALLMLLPFCLVATRFRLYDPAFMSVMDDTARLGVILTVAIAYVLLRAMLTHLLRNGKISPKPYQAACNSFYTFFIMLTLCLLAMAGIMPFTDMEPEVIKMQCFGYQPWHMPYSCSEKLKFSCHHALFSQLFRTFAPLK